MRLLKDDESGQVQTDIIKSLASDLSRSNSRFKGLDSLVVTFCASDVLELQNKVAEAEAPQKPPVQSDEVPQQPSVGSDRVAQLPLADSAEKVSLHQDEVHVGKIAPFMKNEPVEVFSKSLGKWVPAEVVCVQEDSEGIFVTVRRIGGHELDYDIANVRAVRVAPILADHMPMVSKDGAIREQMLH